MSKIRLGVAGANGAFGIKHLEALRAISDVDITAVMATTMEKATGVADRFDVPLRFDDYDTFIASDRVDAIILATPTQLHAEQGIKAMAAGKHVLVEIPMADNLADSERLVAKQAETGLVGMVGHVRRFNPSHQWVHNEISKGALSIQQMDVQTYFFRRTNMNAAGEPRSWVDHLLWHHACHTVDLFQYQTGEVVSECFALEGPHHPELGIAMDMSIGMKVPSGAICTLSLSFNNDGPLGTYFRYIGDNGTYLARYDDLFTGAEEQIDVSKVDVSMNGIELQDREFFAAIKEGREPNSSVAQCLSAMETLDKLEQCLNAQK